MLRTTLSFLLFYVAALINCLYLNQFYRGGQTCRKVRLPTDVFGDDEWAATVRRPNCSISQGILQEHSAVLTCTEVQLHELLASAQIISESAIHEIDELIIDCHGFIFTEQPSESDELVFQNLGIYLRNISVFPSKISFIDCIIFVANKTSSAFDGLADSLNHISFDCCYFDIASEYRYLLLGNLYPSLVSLSNHTTVDFTNNTFTPFGGEKKVPQLVNATQCVKNACLCNQDEGILTAYCLHATWKDIDNFLNMRPNRFEGGFLVYVPYNLYIYDLHFEEPDGDSPDCDPKPKFGPRMLQVEGCDLYRYQKKRDLFRCLLNRLSHADIHHVIIHDCQISESFNSFDNLFFRNLTTLDLSNDGIGPWKVYPKFPQKLVSLNLANNNIRTIDDSSFSGLNVLKILDLSSSEISEISLSAFKDNVKLEVLNLTGNELETIKQAWFQYLPNLKILKLSMSSQTTPAVPPGTFVYLTNLQTLTLTIEKFEPDTFVGLTRLQALTVEASDGYSLVNLSFSGLYELRDVEITTPSSRSCDRNDVSIDNFTTVAKMFTTVKSLVLPVAIFHCSGKANPYRIFAWMPLLRELQSTFVDTSAYGWTQYFDADSTVPWVCRPQIVHWFALQPFAQSLLSQMSHAFCPNLSANSVDMTTISIEELIISLNTSHVSSELPNSSVCRMTNARDVDEENTINNAAANSTYENKSESDSNYAIVVAASVLASVGVAVLFALVFTFDYLDARKTRLSGIKFWDPIFMTISSVRVIASQSLWQQFYAITTINGFSFINATRMAWEKILWYLLIVIFTGLLVHDLANLSIQYRNDIATTVTLSRNSQFTQQRFTLCMPTNNGYVWPPADVVVDILESRFQCTDPKDLFPLEVPFYRDLLLFRLSAQFAWEGGIILNNDLATEAEKLALLHVMDNFTMQHGILYSNLLQTLSVQLCKDMNMVAMLKRESGRQNSTDTKLNFDLCDNSFQSKEVGLTWYDEIHTQTACIRFPDLFSFKGHAATGTLSMRGLNRMIPGQKILLDLRGYPFPTAIFQGQYPTTLWSGNTSTLNLVATNLLQTLEFDRAGHRRCYEDCIATMRTELIQNQCKCRPLMWSKFSDSTLKECSLNDYRQCNLSLFDEYLQCDNSVPCDLWQYSLSKVESLAAENEAIFPDEISMKFAITNGVYVVTQESQSMTLSALLANIGGSLGLWLGATFMGIIHLIIYCLRSIYHRCQRDRHEDVIGPQEAIDRFRMGPLVT